MDELLQKHGCANVFSIPEGLKELMADISREVLRAQPTQIYDFIANYLSALMLTREHGVLATKLLQDLCDCKPTVSEHLMQLGIEEEQAQTIAQVIKEEVEVFESDEGKDTVKEYTILKKILAKIVLDEEMCARVCQVARNAHREYWYRKQTLEQKLNEQPEKPWEIAAQHTLELYKKTKPSMNELVRATQKIQDLEVHEDDIEAMFNNYPNGPSFKNDPMKSVKYMPDYADMEIPDSLSSCRSSLLVFDKCKQGMETQSEGSHKTRSVSNHGEVHQSITSDPYYPMQESSLHKISFVKDPPEVIPDYVSADEIIKTAVVEEIPEEIEYLTETETTYETEAFDLKTDEVPEDIMDDRTEGDGENTDVEDNGEVAATSGEEVEEA
ncbi:hypothetical protein ACJJTC_017172 [Scirpophaga incertulas]